MTKYSKITSRINITTFFNFSDMFRRYISLRSKRFQSSYCAKARAEAKKSPPPALPLSFIFFFCSCPSFLDEPREETLATQANGTSVIFSVTNFEIAVEFKARAILQSSLHCVVNIAH